ncbi:MAG TPA: UDP-N-acetylmuramate--L-alanine ligase [Acidimicrobiales bacterium]|nr:UDP-N-acetylmuramate--L-alanine ligase [Acidimicrobiales bacterium]
MLDLARPRRLHVVGIAGSGMSAIAEVLAAMGHRVSGSDTAELPVLDRLRGLGVDVRVGFDAAHVAGADALAVSTAWLEGNVEVEAARAMGVPVLRRADVLAAICATRRTIAVAGTHGKTTTSAMLATILDQAGRRPSFVVGGRLLGLDTGARWDPEGEWLVVEADESDGTFLRLPAEVAVVTSVEPDHLEHWGGFEALKAAFDQFAGAAKKALVYGDDPAASAIASHHRRPTYGFEARNIHRLSAFEAGGDGSRFTLGRTRVTVPVPGRHNALNAAAALLAAAVAGVGVPEGAAALARFGGVARRFDRRGERDGVAYVDDYAHLPSEVAAALEAARELGPTRVVCVFQPHRYSRTATLWRDFAGAFAGADVLAVTEIYGAGEPARPGVTGKLVLDAALDGGFGGRAAWLPTRPALFAYLRRELRPGDLCLTLGAGDLTTLPDELLGAAP